jgi:anaerobic C4-dicarboxylate transporter
VNSSKIKWKNRREVEVVQMAWRMRLKLDKENDGLEKIKARERKKEKKRRKGRKKKEKREKQQGMFFVNIMLVLTMFGMNPQCAYTFR